MVVLNLIVWSIVFETCVSCVCLFCHVFVGGLYAEKRNDGLFHHSFFVYVCADHILGIVFFSAFLDV